MKKTYYTNGTNEIRLCEDDKIPDGWYKGRVKSTITTKDCIWINNGNEARFINKSDDIPYGWTKGRLKEHLNLEKTHQTVLSKNYKHYTDGVKDYLFSENDDIPKNLVLGRPKMSDEQKRKCSESHKGLHHTEESKKKISENSNNNREKAYNTIIHSFGSIENFYKHIHELGDNTKRKNNTFNASTPENEMYKYLCETYQKENVFRNYKCERYPFRCDFYIKSIDKFIELNLHWTHGFQPYDENNEFCKLQLKEWQEKAKTSQFYAEAIKTWTVRDVEKLKIAKQNKLNYEVIY